MRKISDYVIAALEANGPDLDRAPVEVTHHGDGVAVTLTYPRWLFDLSKKAMHALVNALLKKAGSAVLNAEKFNSGPEVSGLVPDDLIEVYRTLAASEI